MPFRRYLLWFSFLTFGVLIETLSAQSQLLPKSRLTWSEPGNEIRSPRFSPDGNFIVLATRAHWPDGGEAEGLPYSFFRNLENKKKRNPRFADPIVKLISLTGKETCEVRYGWNPDVSSDNERIVFSQQVKPITGFRESAETQAGNAIRMFDCATKRLVNLTDPDEGYLDSPLFSADGKSVLYTYNQAVNGAFGGSVGIGRFDLQLGHKTDLLKTAYVAGVPCPPVNSGKSARESFLCSQIEKPTTTFPRLVLYVAPAGNEVIALLGTPVPAPGDMYVANNYDLEVVTVFPEERKILRLGRKSMENLDDTVLQVLSSREALLFSQYWKLISLATGETPGSLGPKNARRRSIYSPDSRYYLRPDPEGEADHFVLFRTADGKKLLTSPKMAEVHDAVWGADSKRFAIVGLPPNVDVTNYYEELSVYFVP